MAKRIFKLAIALACVGPVANPVLAADTPVTFCGTVEPLTEGGCIGVTSAGIVYEISEAGSKPQVGTLISGSGVPSSNATICIQGKHLTDIKWQAVSACPTADRRPTGY